MLEREDTAEWLEFSGLPAELNKLRAGAWSVFKKIVELDCRRNRVSDAVEISLGELAERCGLEWEKVARIVELLQKKKRLRCFLPDNPDEPGLFQVRAPLVAPRSPEEVARLAADPLLRDPAAFRYTTAPPESAETEGRVQRVVDLYLNTLSQKLNSFIVDQIEALALRFPYDDIQKTMERGARHDVRSLGWVAKELIRDAQKKGDKQP